MRQQPRSYPSRNIVHGAGSNHKHGKRRWLLRAILLVGLVILIAGGTYVGLMYKNIRDTAMKLNITRPENQEIIREGEVDIAKEPFSILLLGIDTGSQGRIDQGRSDVIVVVTVNPNTNTTTMTSIPRDTYIEIAGSNEMDKINHAYAFGGVGMAVNTVQNLLNIPIDYIVSINMQGFKDIIDTVGGVDLTPTASFSQNGYTFVEGETVHMDGDMALAYSQNRYDSGGDYGRQERSRELITAIFKSASTVDSLWNYTDILKSLEGNLQTNLTFDEMKVISSKYRDTLNNVENYQLKGEGEMINGIYYDKLEQASLDNVKEELHKQLELQ